MSAAQAVKLAKGVTTLHAKIGKTLRTYDMKNDPPSAADLKKAVLGRSGTMRAPVLVAGKVMMAGFDAEVYEDLLL